jgi:hypothetical protein
MKGEITNRRLCAKVGWCGSGIERFQGSSQNMPTMDQIVDLGNPFGGLNPYYLDSTGGAQDTYPYITPIA